MHLFQSLTVCNISEYETSCKIYTPASFLVEISGSHALVPGPAAAAASGQPLGMQILGPHPRSTEPDTLLAGAENCS